MKIWRSECFGEAVDILDEVDAPIPQPLGSQIQVKVAAAGVGL
jgi:hypothetical protein